MFSTGGFSTESNRVTEGIFMHRVNENTLTFSLASWQCVCRTEWYLLSTDNVNQLLGFAVLPLIIAGECREEP